MEGFHARRLLRQTCNRRQSPGQMAGSARELPLGARQQRVPGELFIGLWPSVQKRIEELVGEVATSRRILREIASSRKSARLKESS